ncbi:hypothetical protein K402DRAFT_253238 [Aulographum hederae CBS 113979]|uniref:Heterokaryon incompatibility domain-containing protein n=1 Tax=Aulographum hederae CBS 113979 TaxID=1176131 RepID=A0A6G1GJ86_9PEZI|nr:hypothetical protein K402DRAFT_253238 [Aulographum hederae CBS 113979]
MTLCAACDRLARNLSTRSVINPAEYHSEAADLLESARTCRLCKYLVSCVGNIVWTTFERDIPLSVGEILTSSPESLGRIEYWGGQSGCRFYMPPPDWDSNGYAKGCSFAFDVILWANETSPASGIVFHVSPTCDPASTISVIESWLRVCRSEHEACRSTISGVVISEYDDPALPSRVVDVGDRNSSHVRVLGTEGSHGQYCALSHCWGSPDKRPIQTTKQALADHVRGIDFRGLPQDFPRCRDRDPRDRHQISLD